MENEVKNLKLKTVLGKKQLISSLAQKNVFLNEELLDDVELYDPLEKYLYLTYFPNLVESPTSQLNQYYAKYYWLLTLSERYKKKFGEDNGLEQQVFQLLERADSVQEDVDWNFVEKLNNEVTNVAPTTVKTV